MNSTHRVEVVEVNLEPIPGADKVALARVYGYSVVTQKDQWADGKLAAYLPPDSLCDVSRPEFAFLADQARADGTYRIKAKRIRKVLSFGLLVPAPAGAQVGDDVAEQLGVKHYDPVVHSPGRPKGGLVTGGEVASPPPVYTVKYDLEAGRRYAQKVFEPGEPVVVTEKIHGQNARFTFVDGVMYCGSRTEWKKEYPSYEHVTVPSLLATGKVTEERAQEIVEKLRNQPKVRNSWWRALDVTPELRRFCEANPGTVVYGEVYGCVQDLSYNHNKGEISFAAFDLMKDGQWVNAQEFRDLMCAADVPAVPLLYEDLPFDFDKLCELAEGKSLVPGANHVREGIVVSPLAERYDPKVGRVKLKFVGCGYLERAKDSAMEAPDDEHPLVLEEAA